MSFQALTDAGLIEIIERCNVTCERIVALPLAEQQTVAPGRSTALEDIGFVQAIMATLAQRELNRRNGVQAP